MTIENKANFFPTEKKLIKNLTFVIGLTFLSIIIITCIVGPSIKNYTYYETHLELKNLSPSFTFFLGTDELGRDIFTRICYGSRISLIIGICAALIDVIIGMIYGAISAFSNKDIDEIMMRICDILSTIPYLLSVILLLTFMESGLITVIIALSITGWINMARLVRSQILSLKTMPFIQAAKAMGASKTRIIFHHLLPNCFGTIISTLTITIPIAIFTEAFLSFLGLGIQAPISSLGVMVNDALCAIQYYPWRLFFPAITISLIIFSFNLISEGLCNIFNSRQI